METTEEAFNSPSLNLVIDKLFSSSPRIPCGFIAPVKLEKLRSIALFKRRCNIEAITWMFWHEKNFVSKPFKSVSETYKVLPLYYKELVYDQVPAANFPVITA